jgi:uncharacterized protein YpmB
MSTFIMLVLVLVVFLVVVMIAAEAQNEDSHEKHVACIRAKQEETLRQIDETGEYYAGLYRYIARRLDHESRRRQSG